MSYGIDAEMVPDGDEKQIPSLRCGMTTRKQMQQQKRLQDKGKSKDESNGFCSALAQSSMGDVAAELHAFEGDLCECGVDLVESGL
jgi:hypothetical protein